MGEGAGAVVMVIASVTFVHVVWWLVGDSVVTFGNLVDSDGYARLVRIQRLLETGAWFDVGLPRANWPDGGTLHWTRPLDVLLIILALPLAVLIGFSKALFWARVRTTGTAGRRNSTAIAQTPSAPKAIKNLRCAAMPKRNAAINPTAFPGDGASRWRSSITIC